MACIAMSYGFMSYIHIAYTFEAYIVMAYVVLAYRVMAYIAMSKNEPHHQESLPAPLDLLVCSCSYGPY